MLSMLSYSENIVGSTDIVSKMGNWASGGATKPVDEAGGQGR